MTIFKKILAGGTAVAALAAAAPASAQQWGYQYNPYANQYANPYATPYAANPYAANPYAYQTQHATQLAAQRCTAAVQQRLQSRSGLTGVVAALLGAPTQARVVSITQVDPRRSTVRVRGLASTGRMASGYGPYGIGAYGAAGYAYQPDLSFSCSVDYRGYVRDVDINRR